MSDEKYLIVGLGNPGKRYEGTRHNVGYEIVGELAKHYKLSLRESQKLQGYVVEGEISGRKVVFLLPTTYMNLSGSSVRQALRWYNIALPRLLLVADDVAVPFGQLRLKENSGSGGQKGVASVIESLQSEAFPRLKVGIGEKRGEDLSEFVLGKFSSEERLKLGEIKERAWDVILLWLTEGIAKAMNRANLRSPVEMEQNKEIENEQ